MMPKSRRKEKFQFLKQILEVEDSGSDAENSHRNSAKKYTTEASAKIDSSAQTESVKKEKDNAGPTGKYPVLFKKTCRSKSCQTRLSSFPLFPLPEDSEWIIEEEGERKNKKSTASKKKKNQGKYFSKQESKDHVLEDSDHKVTSKVKNSDGSRKSFKSEHQLKETDNPILQAWLHKKSIVARKQRKLERREKRAKRAALEEEARIQEEKAVESNERVGEWLKRKRKEARIAWRKSHTKVAPQHEDSTSYVDATSPQPPPEYRVVRSFKTAKSGHATAHGHAMENGLKNENNFVNGAIPTTSASMMNGSKPTNVSVTSNNSADQLSSQEKSNVVTKRDSNTAESSATNHDKGRPKTAVDRTENASLLRPKTATKRPKTSRQRSSKSPASQVKTNTSYNSTKNMQSLSYDKWLRVKRNEDKEKSIQKKRDLIDTHLEAVIKELGKKRVEKIMSPRKRVDTGLKNVVRSPPPAQQPDTSKVKKNNPYRWVLSKKPRPEPQGCDCPENHGTDGASSCRITNNDDAKDGNSSENSRAHICGEVDEKYNELKPSIEKVKDILDAEIKKLKESGKGTNVAKSSQLQTVGYSITTVDDSSVIEPHSYRAISARPLSAKPVTAEPPAAKSGSPHLTKEQAKKIASDMDVLGLCGSDQEQEKSDSSETGVDVERDTTSTVRLNYFDYGSEVDGPTIKST